MYEKFWKFSLLMMIFAIAGCSSSMIDNVTRKTIPQNSSEIYPIEMHVMQGSSSIVEESYNARIVIDGEIHPMRKIASRDFVYDYRRPRNSHKVKFYYEVDYINKKQGTRNVRTMTSKLYDLTIINRYVVGFENNRGLPGSVTCLLGRGFEPGDRVAIGDVECQTEFVSKNVLSFVIPWLEHPGVSHARLISDNGNIGLGDFTVDPLVMHTNCHEINISKGERKVIVVSIDVPAPKGGVLVDVMTSVPDCIAMKDILIPEGATSAMGVVQGVDTGSGMIYLNANGFNELKVPVEITPEHSSADTLDGEPSDDFQIL